MIVEFIVSCVLAIIMHYFVWVVIDQSKSYTTVVKQYVDMKDNLYKISNQTSPQYNALSI